MHRAFLLLTRLGLLAGIFASSAWAQGTPAFKEGDWTLGERLMVENKCNQCHAQKWADDGRAVYRPLGNVNSLARLRSKVEQCNTELGLNLFPEEVEAVAAVLNRDHYRFRE